MNLNPLQLITYTLPLERQKNGRVIGIKPEKNGTTTYFIEPRSVDFGPLKNGARVLRVNSRDINKCIKIETHN